MPINNPDGGGGGGDGAFSTTSNVTSNAPGALGTDDFVFGSDQLDDDGDTTHDRRVIYDKSQGFFGAGRVDSTQWDSGNRGTDAVVFGINCTASGARSFASGNGNISSGSQSFTLGGANTASALNSSALGNQSLAALSGQSSYASGFFSVQGDAQRSVLVARRQTTDATQTELTLNSAAPSSTSRLIIPASTTWGFTVYITGRQDSSTNCGYYRIDGLMKRDGSNNTTLTGSVTVTTIAEDTAGWDVTAAADDTNESLQILVTGIAATTIRWVASVYFTEVL